MCTILGAWYRLIVVAKDEFVFVIIGQMIVACGQPFYFNTISILSSSWFGEKEVIIGKSTNILESHGSNDNEQLYLYRQSHSECYPQSYVYR